MTWHLLIGWLMLLMSVAAAAVTTRYAVHSRKIYATLHEASAYERYKWIKGDSWRVWIGGCLALGYLYIAGIHLGWPPTAATALVCLVYASLPVICIAQVLVKRRFLPRPQPTPAHPRTRRRPLR